MTTSTLTVTDFVLARIAEDEAVARAAGPDGRPLGGHWVSRYPDQPDYHMYGEWGWFISGADVETDDSEWGKSVADHIARHDPARVLAQCAAMRKIVELHASWPVLAQTPPEFAHDDGDLSSMTMRMTQQIAWTTEREYRNRFGEEPPAAPMIHALASTWSDHPQFNPDWS